MSPSFAYLFMFKNINNITGHGIMKVQNTVDFLLILYEMKGEEF